MINKIKLQKTVKNLGHKTSEHIQTIIDFANFVPNDELVKAKPSMSQEELTHIINTEIIDACGNGLSRPSQYVANCVNAILAGISKKQEVSFDKEKTAILNELVNGTGKK